MKILTQDLFRTGRSIGQSMTSEIRSSRIESLPKKKRLSFSTWYRNIGGKFFPKTPSCQKFQEARPTVCSWPSLELAWRWDQWSNATKNESLRLVATDDKICKAELNSGCLQGGQGTVLPTPWGCEVCEVLVRCEVFLEKMGVLWSKYYVLLLYAEVNWGKDDLVNGCFHYF